MTSFLCSPEDFTTARMMNVCTVIASDGGHGANGENPQEDQKMAERVSWFDVNLSICFQSALVDFLHVPRDSIARS